MTSPPLTSQRRLLLTAAAGTALGALAGAAAPDQPWPLLVGMTVGGIGGPICVIDIRARRIPNHLVLQLGLAAVAIGIAMRLDGGHPLANGLLGAAGAGTPLLVVHLISPRGLGFGDVKLGFALGALLSLVSPAHAIGTVAVAAIAVILGSALGAWRRSTGAPFGAFLVLSALALLLGRSMS